MNALASGEVASSGPGTTSAPDASIARSPVPVAHCCSFRSSGLRESGCDVSAVTSSSCAPAAPSAGCARWAAGHQFQLRIGRSFRWVHQADTWFTSSSCASRASSRGRVEWSATAVAPEAFRDDVTRSAAFRRRRQMSRKGQAPPPFVGSTVITAGAGLRIGSRRLLPAPLALVTPAWSRSYDPLTGETSRG